MKLFITGTDTNVGKTFISTALLECANNEGFKTIGIKPIASGTTTSTSRQNEDAMLLQKTSSIALPYESINPFVFTPPTAPHIAAEKQNCQLSVKLLSEKLQPLFDMPADLCLIEGAGGWLTPLNETETIADFVIAHQLPVLLVVGIRLGCINHSLLTQRALIHDKMNVIGWIANCIDPDMLFPKETINTLKKLIQFPHLATIAYART